MGHHSPSPYGHCSGKAGRQGKLTWCCQAGPLGRRSKLVPTGVTKIESRCTSDLSVINSQTHDGCWCFSRFFTFSLGVCRDTSTSQSCQSLGVEVRICHSLTESQMNQMNQKLHHVGDFPVYSVNTNTDKWQAREPLVAPSGTKAPVFHLRCWRQLGQVGPCGSQKAHNMPR